VGLDRRSKELRKATWVIPLNESSKKPIRARAKLEDLPYAFSLLVKELLAQEWMGLYQGEIVIAAPVVTDAVPEPHHSEVLLCFTNLSPSRPYSKNGRQSLEGI